MQGGGGAQRRPRVGTRSAEKKIIIRWGYIHVVEGVYCKSAGGLGAPLSAINERKASLH